MDLFGGMDGNILCIRVQASRVLPLLPSFTFIPASSLLSLFRDLCSTLRTCRFRSFSPVLSNLILLQRALSARRPRVQIRVTADRVVRGFSLGFTAERVLRGLSLGFAAERVLREFSLGFTAERVLRGYSLGLQLTDLSDSSV